MHLGRSLHQVIKLRGVVGLNLLLAIVLARQHYFQRAATIQHGLGKNGISATSDAAHANQVVTRMRR